METGNRTYYRKRIDEESRRAQAEGNPSVRHVHETLANLYQLRLAEEERELFVQKAKSDAAAGSSGPDLTNRRADATGFGLARRSND